MTSELEKAEAWARKTGAPIRIKKANPSRAEMEAALVAEWRKLGMPIADREMPITTHSEG